MTAPSVVSLVLLGAARRARAVNDHRPAGLQKGEGRAGHPAPYRRLPSSAAAARLP